jgi:hypothetical protein
MSRPDELTFAPLGGVGEIGMNLSIYGLGNRHQRSWLAIDLGVSFGNEEHLPGIDVIMPDIRFLVKERKNLVGLVLTHAHEDHFGAIIDLWPQLKCPIYATQFSAALFEAKCASERNPPKIPVTVVPSGSIMEIGPFSVEFIPGAHSIPESHALAIKTPVGTVLHTGDWKIDPTPIIGRPTDEERLRAIGDEGVLALVGDSTNAVREGRSPSEQEVAKSIAELVKAAKGRVAVTTFASNVARLRAGADAARAADREVVVVGRAMERVQRPMVGCTAIVQGFGNVGSVAARTLVEQGVRVIGVSDHTACYFDPKGLDVPALLRHAEQHGVLHGFSNEALFDPARLLEQGCDVLIPAATEQVITGENAQHLRCRVLAEGANGPCTPEADEVLEARRDEIFVIPDILCNAGGVVVSYFEWVQDLQQLFWTEAEVRDRLNRILERAFQAVMQRAQRERVSHRMAAMAIGVEKVRTAKQVRGLFP